MVATKRWLMNRACVIVVALVCSTASDASAQDFKADVAPLVSEFCIHCHDADTDTRLNLETLGHDLANPGTFRRWVQVFDRIQAGEMPPASEPQPDATQRESAISSLQQDLQQANLAARREHGRVRSRRLTRTEYGYTLRDLFMIDEDFSERLPAESDSGGFDTVGDGQGISAIHIESYLRAADEAINSAINLRPRPPNGPQLVDYYNSPYVNMWFTRAINAGGQNIRKLDDAIGLLIDLDFLMMSDRAGFRIPTPGMYRFKVEAYAYQANTPVTLKLIKGNFRAGTVQFVQAFDLLPDQTRTFETTTTFMKPGDYINPIPADIRSPGELGIYGGGLRRPFPPNEYPGEIVALKSLHVEGPLVETWPPPSTRELLPGVEFIKKDQGYSIKLEKEPLHHVHDVIARIAPLALRRPAEPGEVESFVALAEPAIDEGLEFMQAVSIPLRAILSSPQFMFHGGKPGKLDDYTLATRLSYFLWKSMPDAELFQLAEKGELSKPEILAQQVDRMLVDEKSRRFINDFVGQWLRLHEIDATTPDKTLYPEYNEILRQAILDETRSFFAELIKENLPARNLIDSDFTFLNRPLAEHYGIDGIEGQQIRKVQLPADSPRGGILTQASVLKVTANGTLTSPVPRGNFVLTSLLGQPPSPPPPGIASIEPDTRGTTTIRETLEAHRNIEACARCHREIDPPGFAMECFDPIGRFRTTYRATPKVDPPKGALLLGITRHFYDEGQPVDSSGVTAGGKPFSGINEFKTFLLEHEDQLVRHFISQLMVFATGGEIEFADREEIDRITRVTKVDGYRVRDILHEVVRSELFREK